MQYTRNKIHPHKFALWVACASIVMMFVAFTSAYVVRQAAGNWLEFKLPMQFFYSAGVILLSSLTLHWSYISFLKEREQSYKLLLILTFFLGIVFVILQYLGWVALQESGVQFNGNPAGSFVYVISWVHAAHVIGGIAVLTVALIHAFRLLFRVTPRRKLRLEMTMTYWHFVDALWIYLLVFMVITR